MITLRFDMRSPDFGAARTDLYAAAVEMCEWAEQRGVIAAVVSEHHGSEDGYLPSPLVLATAIAARTKQLMISLAAVLLPLYDPVRLAEEMSVLDIISQGRVSYVFGVGYRPEEYEQFGRDFRRRGRAADDALDLVLRLLRGEMVERDGRRIRITPPPFTAGGPTIMWGGTSIAAVERAARFGLGFLGQSNVDGLAERYAEACRELGHEPGMAMFPDKDTAAVTFVAEDLDAAWRELGPHLLHDARAYAAWNPGNDTSAGISHATSVEELRRGRSHQILTPAEAAAQIESGQLLVLSPLCGGLSPDIAWRYLEHAVTAGGSSATTS